MIASDKLAEINARNAKFWVEDREKLDQLTALHRERPTSKKPDRDAYWRLEEQRIIVDAFAIATGHSAAALALENLKELRGRQQAEAKQHANRERKNDADQRAIANYRSWEKRVEVQLRGLNILERVARYRATAHISDRARRRINSLLRAGKF